MTTEQITARQAEIAEELYEIHQRQSALWREQESLLGQQKQARREPRPRAADLVAEQTGSFRMRDLVSAHPELTASAFSMAATRMVRSGLLQSLGRGFYSVCRETAA